MKYEKDWLELLERIAKALESIDKTLKDDQISVIAETLNKGN